MRLPRSLLTDDQGGDQAKNTTRPVFQEVDMIRKALAGSAALLLALVTALVMLVVPAAAAAPTECTGTLLVGTYDNVVVPSGADCEMLPGTTVTGNVLVRADASLRASGSNISGHVIGRDTSWVCVQFGSEVGGNFDVTGGDPGTTTGFDISVMVGGNAKVSENAGLTFIDAAEVGGNIDVSENTGTLEIEFNTVGGNVKIADNFVPLGYTGGPATPLFGGCGVPTSFLLNAGGMSDIFNDLGSSSNMHVIRNSGPGSKTVTDNTVKNLVCLNNDLPFVGGPNNAQHAVGQCF